MVFPAVLNTGLRSCYWRGKRRYCVRRRVLGHRKRSFETHVDLTEVDALVSGGRNDFEKVDCRRERILKGDDRICDARSSDVDREGKSGLSNQILGISGNDRVELDRL